MASSQSFLTAETIDSLITHRTLIDHLQASIPSADRSLWIPPRESHRISPTSTLIVIPSWSHRRSLPYMGVMLISRLSLNPARDLPLDHATYTLFSSTTGVPLTSIDGSHMSLLRIACVSALAAKFLAREASTTLTILGAGALAKHLIRAHLAARPGIRRVIVWSHKPENATKLVEEMAGSGGGDDVAEVRFERCESLEEAVKAGDIVSFATDSKEAVLKMEWFKSGSHIDIIGVFKLSMRVRIEVGPKRVKNLAKNHETVMVKVKEEEREEEKDDFGNLVEIVKGEKGGRKNEHEITVFSQVDSTPVDILTAQLVYETYMKKNHS